MDDPTSNQFIASLVKSVQALCGGYIDFCASVEVIGHIHLNIDHKFKLDYVLTEKLNKSDSDDSPLCSSHSYRSKPPDCQTEESPIERSQSTSSSHSAGSSRRRKSHHVPRVDESENLSFMGLDDDKDKTVTNVSEAHNKERLSASSILGKIYSLTHEIDSPKIGEVSSVPSSNTDGQEKRDRSAASLLTSTSRLKRKRSDDTDSKLDEPEQPVTGPEPLLMKIKEEPEDDMSAYPSSAEALSEDLASPDLKDPNLTTAFLSQGLGVEADTDEHQPGPYPVLLHTSSKLSMAPVALPESVSGAPSDTANLDEHDTPVPSTSAVAIYKLTKVGKQPRSVRKSKLSNAQRSKQYREHLKNENTAKALELRLREQARCKRYREQLTEEQKAHSREKARIRQQRKRRRAKAMAQNQPTSSITDAKEQRSRKRGRPKSIKRPAMPSPTIEMDIVKL